MANPRKRALGAGVAKALSDMGITDASDQRDAINSIRDGDSALSDSGRAAGLEAIGELALSGIARLRQESGRSTAREVAGEKAALPDGEYPSTFTDDASVGHYRMADESASEPNGIVTDNSREAKYIPAMHAPQSGDGDEFEFTVDPSTKSVDATTTGVVFTIDCDLRKQNNGTETGYLTADTAHDLLTGAKAAPANNLTEVLGFYKSKGVGVDATLALAEASFALRCGDDLDAGTGRSWAAGDRLVIVDGAGAQHTFTAVAADPAAGQFVGVGQTTADATTNLIAAIDADERFDCSAGAGASDITIGDVMGKGENNADAAGEATSASKLVVFIEDSSGDQIKNEGDAAEVVCEANTTTALDGSVAVFADGVGRTDADGSISVAVNITGGDGSGGSLDNVDSYQVTLGAVALDEFPVIIKHTAGATDQENAVGNRGYAISWSETDA